MKWLIICNAGSPVMQLLVFPLSDQDIQDWEGEAVPEVPQEENWFA